MNIFRKKSVCWYVLCLISVFFAIWGYRIIQNHSVEQIHEVYEIIFKDFLLLGIIFPMFSFIILKKAEEVMSYTKMLQWESRKKWWGAVMKTNIRVSIVFVTILMVPTGIISLIFLGKLASPSDYLYIILTFVTYEVLFMMVSLLIMVTKIKWNSDIVSIFAVLLAGFLPMLMVLLFREGFLTLSEIINAKYAFEGTRYMGHWNLVVFAILLVILLLGVKAVERYVKSRDFLWK